MPDSWESEASWEVSLDRKKENIEFLQRGMWTFRPVSQASLSLP